MLAHTAPRRSFKATYLLVALALLSASFTAYYLQRNMLIAYGDAESHLNIAKRVIHSLTPGLAQLGGIWLPLPHMLMLPFVAFEPLYRTGLAGSIVGGASYCASGLFIYKTGRLLSGSVGAGLLACAVFALNPNILYLQATPMSELPLLACFTGSTYFIIRFIQDDSDLLALLLAAFFGFLATLSRYDGWFLVLAEAAALAGLYIFQRDKWTKMQGLVVLFATLAFFGIGLWLLWDLLILGDALYFTNSPFSAKSQQNGWAARGQLPSYHNLSSSVAYYSVTAALNSGVIIFGLGLLGLVAYVLLRPSMRKVLIAGLLMAPYAFYVATLYVGQSIILVPELTPKSFGYTLFNVRYGVVLIPAVALLVAHLFASSRPVARWLVVALVALNLGLFASGTAQAITVEDGISGLSRQKSPDAEGWLAREYDGGLLLLDDYAKTVSIIRSRLPMQNLVYIGNKPGWEKALREPQTTVRWIAMQQGDMVYQNFMRSPQQQGLLYKYFEKVYTSPEILIFRRNAVPIAP